jgi:hypothetical protein
VRTAGWIVGEHVVHPIDAVSPHGFQLLEQSIGLADRLDVAAYELFASISAFDHEPCALEHRDVLLHRGEAHGI